MKLKLLIMSMLIVGVANASIVITIDLSTETFSFSGNDIMDSSDINTWSNTDNTISEQIECAGAFSHTGDGFSIGDPWVQVGSSEIRVTSNWYNFSTSSVFGSGASFDYSTLSEDSKNYLKGLDGALIPSQNSTGISSLEFSVIPEPSMFVVIMALMSCSIVVRRKIHIK